MGSAAPQQNRPIKLRRNGTHGRPSRRGLRRGVAAGLLVAAALAATLARPGPQATQAVLAATTTTTPTLSVSGNHFVNGSGQTVQLRGVNRSSFVNYCSDGFGFAQGPVTQAGVDAIKAWGVNAVRLQLNEDCWLGINGMPAAYSGANYRNAVANYIRYADNDGMYVVLSLAFNAPGGTKSLAQNVMADQSHAPAFWNSVAGKFGHNNSVVFDLYNEPRPNHGADTTASYQCILKGGSCGGAGFAIAGMQELVNDVRGDGATNVLLVGGPNASERLDQWLAYKPADPRRDIAASLHVYNASPYNSAAMWNTYVAPVAAKVPVVTGEMGEDPQQTSGCQYSFSPAYTTWADSHGVSYFAFDWDTWRACDALISNYNGTPTGTYGNGWKAHFLADKNKA